MSTTRENKMTVVTQSQDSKDKEWIAKKLNACQGTEITTVAWQRGLMY
jgi:hypothetical protein